MSLVEAAIAYTRYGMRVFPCTNKRPTCPNGFKDASDKAVEVAALFKKYPGDQIGIATGVGSALVVVDCDGWSGMEGWKLMSEDQDVGDLLTFTTPSGGLHLWYTCSMEVLSQIKCSVGELAPKIDIRCEGGYVIACPSAGYEMQEEPDTDELEIPWLPSWLEAELLKLGPPGQNAVTPEPSAIEGDLEIPDSKRNATLASMGGAMRRVGYEGVAINAALQATNKMNCKPPLPEREVQRIAESIATYSPTVDPRVGVPESVAAGFDPIALSTLLARPIPAQHWLIEGILPGAGLGMLYGDSNSGKSFFGLDMALSIGSGLQNWMGREIKKPGAAYYLWGEGGDSLLRRCHAWRVRHTPLADHFHIHNPESVALPLVLSDPASVARCLQVIKEIGQETSLIVLDTLATLNAGTDENDVASMMLAINQIRTLSLELNCLCLLIHHTGHGNKGRERGSSAIRAAMDVSIRIDAMDKANGFPMGLKVHCAKMRGTRFFDEFDLRFEQVVIHDEARNEAIELALSNSRPGVI